MVAPVEWPIQPSYMTLLDWYAGLAMLGLLVGRQGNGPADPDFVAEDAVNLATAVMGATSTLKQAIPQPPLVPRDPFELGR